MEETKVTVNFQLIVSTLKGTSVMNLCFLWGWENCGHVYVYLKFQAGHFNSLVFFACSSNLQYAKLSTILMLLLLCFWYSQLKGTVLHPIKQILFK